MEDLMNMDENTRCELAKEYSGIRTWRRIDILQKFEQEVSEVGSELARLHFVHFIRFNDLQEINSKESADFKQVRSSEEKLVYLREALKV